MNERMMKLSLLPEDPLTSPLHDRVGTGLKAGVTLN